MSDASVREECVTVTLMMMKNLYIIGLRKKYKVTYEGINIPRKEWGNYY